MATLNIMIGIPGSGKTSYAINKLLNNGVEYLSSDQIRIELYGFEDQSHNDKVFDVMKERTLSALRDNKDVIYDATNLSKKYRREIINKAKEIGAKVDAYMCCVPINIILERNISRTERQLPWEKLIQMIQSIEPPMYYEGFENIYLIDGGMYNDIYDYNFLIKKCEGYTQDNPHHLETLSEHIIAVTKKAESLGEILTLRNDAEILRQAARYHDFGKIYTKSFNEKKGYYVYYGHDKVSTYLYLCHVRKQNFVDNYDRVRLGDGNYQTAALILNHMEWYRRENMGVVRKMFDDDNLFNMLIMLHEADLWGRNENAKEDYYVK